ncbi:hypothetical protein ACHQM5_014779 [Ranunculus cassubicifolius]
MENTENAWRAHVVLLPLPFHGHINPMLNFSAHLASKGIKVTLAIPLSIFNSVEGQKNLVTIEPYYDGYEKEGGDWTIDSYMEMFKEIGSKNVSKIIEAHQNSKHPVKCLVYSSVFPLALEIAKLHGLIGASFFTQSCAVNALYYHLHLGTPLQGTMFSLPGIPLLGVQDLPLVFIDNDENGVVRRVLLSQFTNISEIDWLLFNTYEMLENEVVQWLGKQLQQKMITIGPTVHFDEQLPFGLTPSIEWLNTKETGSVVFVSFGSVVKLSEEQIQELAWGLNMSNKYFLWVLRKNEEHKLPANFKISEKGLVIPWCMQLQVLANKAMGCFVTHCGWNSTVEALSLGVPMVAIPKFTDQPTNAKYVQDVWKVGVRAKADEKGIVRKGEIVKCIKDVMEGERSDKMRENAVMWKELAKEALDQGGSSDVATDKFINTLVSHGL